MKRLKLQPTPLAQWRALVQDAEKACGKQLAEELENYLVLLLQRFVNKPEIARCVLALEYLETQAKGAYRQDQLREVGDKCLLFSGLFPERAIHENVNVTYFVELGQQAYHLLAALLQQRAATAELFNALDHDFIYLVDTLQCMRELAGKEYGISPLQAEELWRKTGSQHAWQVLKRYIKGLPAGDDSTSDIIH